MMSKTNTIKNEFNINNFEKKIYSQNGEDGILEYIFSVIGTTNKFFVEFGVGDGLECNTRHLKENKEWNGLMMDAGLMISLGWTSLKYVSKKIFEKNQKTKPIKKIPLDIKKETITVENIEKLFLKYSVPKYFDLLSIDIDSNDYWVWKAIKNYEPRVIVIEYNSTIHVEESKVIEYNPKAKWDCTNYFGASLLALTKLGESKGYRLIGCDSNGINAFFCKAKLIQKYVKQKPNKELYRPPKFGKIVDEVYVGHQSSTKKMLEV